MVIATLRGYNFCNKSESRKANKAVNQLFWPIGGKGLVDLLLVYWFIGLLVYWFIDLCKNTRLTKKRGPHSGCVGVHIHTHKYKCMNIAIQI